jgi:hypothetical protein
MPETKAAAPPPPIKFAEGFPPPWLPVVFGDVIANLAVNDQIAKFYILRTNPDISGKNEYENQPAAQIVMPLSAFIGSLLFLNRMIDRFVENGLIGKEYLESLKKQSELSQAEYDKERGDQK